ncbi:hypothetical protein A8H35_20595 [Burkholderia thailandensis]|nr:hypothetical protein A8H35_20595 [Burkholderia thailandensis]PNE72591.1 hypothetical protein A8H38_11400 [Burkholderia thailandensis]
MIAAPWLRMGSSTERAARAASLYRHDERVPRKSTCVAKLFFEEGDVRRLPSSPRVASRRGEARRGEARRGGPNLAASCRTASRREVRRPSPLAPPGRASIGRRTERRRAPERRLSTISVDKRVDILRTHAPSL